MIFDCHIPDDYQYCRRCGILTILNEPCDPPDVLELVNRRIASISANNAMESDVQWAIRSLTEDARRKSHKPRFEDL